jgi:ATP-dependent Clp protease ATP-binding subunit ClpA
MFKTLRDEHLKDILNIELGSVQQRILWAVGGKQFVFQCTQRAKDALLAEGTDPKYGARHLKRTIERQLVFPLANMTATDQIKLGDYISVDYEGPMPANGQQCEGTFTFVREAENVMVPNLLENIGAMGSAAPTGRVVIPKKIV